MIIFSECGRVWPCSCKHDQFDPKTYGLKHFKKPVSRWGGGYSALRDEQGEFQPGCDKLIKASFSRVAIIRILNKALT